MTGPILKIEHSRDPGFLHVEMSSTTDMSFDVQIPPSGFDQLIEDLCAIAPALMRIDSEVQEVFDNPWLKDDTAKSALADLAAIQAFTQKYTFKNCQIAIDGFPVEKGDGHD